GSDGSVVRAPDDLGTRAWLPGVRAWHGSALRLPGFAGGLALESARVIPLRARGRGLQLPGTARLQREVRPDLGAALSRLPGRPSPAPHHGRRVGARGRGLSTHFPEMSPPQNEAVASTSLRSSARRRALIEGVISALILYVFPG